MPKSLLLAGLCSILATVAVARADGKHRPHCPPPEAIDACDQKAAGDACAFDTPDGDQVSGTCWKPSDAPDDAPLACAPPEVQQGGGPHGDHKR